MLLPPRVRRGPTVRPAYRPRLRLEALDGRDTPAGFGFSSFGTYQAPVANQAPPPPAANQPPVITDFRAVVGPNGQVTFSGKVTDDQPVGGTVVHITGNGIDVTATVLSDGTFQTSTTAYGTADVTVTAQVTDARGATSAPVQTTFTPSAGGQTTYSAPSSYTFP